MGQQSRRLGVCGVCAGPDWESAHARPWHVLGGALWLPTWRTTLRCAGCVQTARCRFVRPLRVWWHAPMCVCVCVTALWTCTVRSEAEAGDSLCVTHKLDLSQPGAREWGECIAASGQLRSGRAAVRCGEGMRQQSWRRSATSSSHTTGDGFECPAQGIIDAGSTSMHGSSARCCSRRRMAPTYWYRRRATRTSCTATQHNLRRLWTTSSVGWPALASAGAVRPGMLKLVKHIALKGCAVRSTTGTHSGGPPEEDAGRPDVDRSLDGGTGHRVLLRKGG